MCWYEKISKIFSTKKQGKVQNKEYYFIVENKDI